MELIELSCFFILLRNFTKEGTEWTAGAWLLFSYEIANPVLGLFADNWWSYIGWSIVYFVLLLITIIFLATVISKISYKDFGDSATIYMVLAFYPALILFSRFIHFFLDNFTIGSK